MAKAMTAASEVCSSRQGEDRLAVTPLHRDGAMNLPFLVAKNLLFWGSISLSLYALYALVAAL